MGDCQHDLGHGFCRPCDPTYGVRDFSDAQCVVCDAPLIPLPCRVWGRIVRRQGLAAEQAMMSRAEARKALRRVRQQFE